MYTLASMIEAVPVIAIVGTAVVAVVAIVIVNLRMMMSSRAVEQTRREIAAYVAEGTISPEEAERLLKAGPAKARQGGC